MTEAIFYDWKSNLEINILINRVLGLWPDGDDSFKPGFYVVYCAILIILATCHLLSQTIKLYLVRDDIEALAGTMYITLTLMLAAIKTFFVIVKMRILKKCFKTLRTNSLFQPRNHHQELIIQLGITYELFLFCYYGNEVQVKSNLVSRAAYESQWTDLPEDVKRSLTIFIINVSKPIDISAFNVFVLSLETFIKILKTAWSYFALLSQLIA
ncbi:odorant receptor 85f-like [Zophobas morio]|uniref:odorant receptor 85f-like n=1 Tax=Zophobas morio TaxID=2755281 RepID=UPI0030827BBC